MTPSESRSNFGDFGSRFLGLEAPFLVAEVAQAHDGSLGSAHAYIDLVADLGVDVVKFQTHFAAEESSIDDLFREGVRAYDTSRFEYWKRMEFTETQWLELKDHSQERGLVFLSSPFSVRAVRLLESIGVAGWKIGSGEVENAALVDEILKTGKPTLLSTGMSNSKSIADSVALFSKRGSDILLFQCTSKYPTPLTEVGLNLVRELREEFGVPVGLSDHSGSIWPAVFAMSQGATAIEFHVTFHKKAYGPDVEASLDPYQIGQLVEARDAWRELSGVSVDKDALALELSSTKMLFARSLVFAGDFSAGHVLEEGDLVERKPGTGIPGSKKESFIGRRLAVSVDRYRLLHETHLIP